MSLFERISLLIWKMKNHDQMIQELEADLEEAYNTIDELQSEIARLKGGKHEKDLRPGGRDPDDPRRRAGAWRGRD